MTLQQEYDRLYHLLTKESKRRKSLFVKDMWRSNTQQDIIEQLVKYLENLNNKYFVVTYVDRETKSLCYHVKMGERDKSTLSHFTVPFSAVFNKFKQYFIENFYRWFRNSCGWNIIHKSTSEINRLIDNYFDTIKKDNARLFFMYPKTIEEGINNAYNRKKAYCNRMLKVATYYDSLMKKWESENPGRPWLDSMTCRSLQKFTFVFLQAKHFMTKVPFIKKVP